MRYFRLFLVLLALLPGAGGALAQDRDQTLADVRQDLSVLYVEIQKLKRELSTTGGAQATAGSGSMLDRVNAIESELQRLTAQTEQIGHRLDRVVEDGTARIGDLEFRLVELEGGDVSKLDETTTLGQGPAASGAGAGTGSATQGGDGSAAVENPIELPPAQQGGVTEGATTTPAAPETGGVEMAVGEEADFRRAEEALANGDFRGAADLFATYVQTYPGSPLEAEAQLRRGDALDQAGDGKGAARAYLDSFSGHPDADVAPEALLKLGRALDGIGQREAACQTLAQMENRFPAAPQVSAARQAMSGMGCP
ncbi:tol-pal system protein YbgF [Aquicoccus sp. SCR17]|nr:tol-pal system protein YbgF [Carideicomes alvinocaridis]